MSVLDALRQRAQDWAKRVVILYNTDVPPALENDKQKLLNRAKTIKNTLEKIFGTLEELRPMAQIQELGAIPILVPTAVIGGASAGIAAWYLSEKNFYKKLDTYKELRATGLDHDQAIAVVGDRNKENSFQSARKLIVPVGLMGLAYLFFKR